MRNMDIADGLDASDGEPALSALDAHPAETTTEAAARPTRYL